MVADQLQRQSESPLSEQAPSKEEALIAISGNLCRCTGYRPILDAVAVAWQQRSESTLDWPGLSEHDAPLLPNYRLPESLAELQQCLQEMPDTGAIVAGATDAWLEVTQQYKDMNPIVDVSRVTEMRQIEEAGAQVRIGGAVSHKMLLDYFSTQRPVAAICRILERFGSPQIRARGTIGGNIGNASPIADWPPLLLALAAQVELMQADGTVRTVALDEYYLGYKQTQRLSDEVITQIVCSTPADDELFAAKVSKRTEDDISSVLMAALLQTDEQGRLATVRIAFGGVAATPVRVNALEDLLRGVQLDTLSAQELTNLCARLDQFIQPISDVRASAEYRLEMAKNLLLQALLAKSGAPVEDLHDV